MCFHLCSDGSQVIHPHFFFSHELRRPKQNSALALIKFSFFFCDSSALAPVTSFISSTGTCTTMLTTTPLQKRGKASGALRFDPVDSSAAAVLPQTIMLRMSTVECKEVGFCHSENSSLVLPAFFLYYLYFWGFNWTSVNGISLLAWKRKWLIRSLIKMSPQCNIF